MIHWLSVARQQKSSPRTAAQLELASLKNLCQAQCGRGRSNGLRPSVSPPQPYCIAHRATRRSQLLQCNPTRTEGFRGYKGPERTVVTVVYVQSCPLRRQIHTRSIFCKRRMKIFARHIPYLNPSLSLKFVSLCRLLLS